MAVEIITPYESFFETDGTPLENGYIYIGEESQNPETVPTTVYWDESLTTPASQPLRTLGGYVVRSGTPAKVFTDGNYSITVRDKNSKLVYSLLSQPLTEVAEKVYNVDTIDDLIALDLKEGTVNVKGYYTVSDGGGGLFNYDSSQSAVNNSGTIINGWVRQEPRKSVKMFGAKDDGITDNTSTYTNIINSLEEGAVIEWDNDGGIYIGDFVSTKSFILQGNGSTLQANGLVAGSSWAIKFSGSLGSYSALSAAPAYGDLSLTGVSGLTEDAYVVLYSGTQRPSDNQAINYEVLKIQSDGTVYDKVYSDQDGGTPTYAVMTPIEDVVVDNFNIQGDAIDCYGIFCEYSVGANISNIKMTGGRRHTVRMFTTYNATVHHIQRIQPSETTSGLGYNVSNNTAKYTKFYSIYGEVTRHDFDQDSAYVTDVKGIISVDCQSAAIDIAHNSFAGFTTVKDCNVSKCNSQAVYASAQGVASAADALFRECVVDNIKISNTRLRDASEFYVAIQIAYPSENVEVTNISVKNLLTTTFDYPGGTYNSAYYIVRLNTPRMNAKISNIEADIARAVLWCDNIDNENCNIVMDTIRVEFYEAVLAVNNITGNKIGAIKLTNINFFDSGTVYGRAVAWFLETSNVPRTLMISNLCIIPAIAKVISLPDNLVGIAQFSNIDTAGFTRRLASLNSLIAGDTITQYQYLRAGDFTIWSSSSKSLSATEPFERPVTSGQTFGILNYSGSSTLTIPANSETVTNTSDLLIEPGLYYEFSANSNGNKWTLMRKQSGMTLS